MENLNELKPVGKLSPFAHFCCTIGNLPTSYMISLTYEEQLLWLCNYLEKTVIPAVNTNAEAVAELQSLYNQLKKYVDNYFDNLDVQEEINNKLDQMAESGQLQEIITSYLNVNGILAFNTVNDMKNATNLVNGSFASTLGYYNINDGGKAQYKIRQITNEDIIDNGSIIPLVNSNNLIAELITDEANVKKFGAKGDNLTDDTTSISNAMIYARKNKLAVYFPKGKYVVTNKLPNMDAGSIMYGDESIGSNSSYSSQIIDNRVNNREWLIEYYQVDQTTLLNERGTTIRNLAFINSDDNNEDTKWLINFRYILETVLIENLFIQGYERIFYANDTNNIVFRNIRCDKVGSYTDNENKYYAFDFDGLFGSLFDNLQIDKSRYMFKSTTRNGSTLGGQCRFVNCHFEQTSNFNTTSSSPNDALILIDTNYTHQFENCMFVPADSEDYSSNAPYMIYSPNSRVLINNCYFFGAFTNRRKSLFINGICSISNCDFVNCSNRAVILSEGSNISNSHFNYYADSDVTNLIYIIDNNIKNMPKCENNILNITLSPNLTSLTLLPALFMFYQDYSLEVTDKKYNKSLNYQITNKWTSMFAIQKTYPDFTLNRPYKIKISSLISGADFYYEGIIKVNNNGSVEKVQNIVNNNVESHPIDIWNLGNKLMIQVDFINSWVDIKVEDLNNLPLTCYMDNTSVNVGNNIGHLYINS